MKGSSMVPNRREILVAGLAALAARVVARGEERGRVAIPIGLVIHSFPIHPPGTANVALRNGSPIRCVS